MNRTKYCIYCGTLYKHPNISHSKMFCQECKKAFYPQPSVAVAAFVVQEGTLLLVKRKEDPYKNCWVIPSGFVDYGENPDEALMREMREELSISIPTPTLFHAEIGHEPEGRTILGLYYYVKEFTGVIRSSGEVGRAKRFDLKNLPKMGFTSNNNAWKILSKNL